MTDSVSLRAVDLSRPRRIHVIAIGGSGMSAIAVVLHQMGHTVTGSDAADGLTMDRIRAMGMTALVGHRPANLPLGTELVVASTAVRSDNVEVKEAGRRGLEVLHRAEMLAAMCAIQPALAVAGTDGKTTTSGMLATVLHHAGWDPSYLVGAHIAGLETAAHWSGSEWFVVEADESDGTFEAIPRRAAVVTNIKPDHLEFHGGLNGLHAAFDRFIAGTLGPVLVCADDDVARSVAANRGLHTYGEHETALYRLADIRPTGSGTDAKLTLPEGSSLPVHVPVPGTHNLLNATGAVALGHLLGMDAVVAVEAIARYQGVARRFQDRGMAKGVRFVDDYAHLPDEVRAAIAAGRQSQLGMAEAGNAPGRVVVVFQPHRYSRTRDLAHAFACAFDGADVLVVSGIYTAGEPPIEGVTGRMVADATCHPNQLYVEDRADLAVAVAPLLQPGDLCLTLGAGDLTRLPDELKGTL